jgi:hypothetical protein
MEQKERFEKIRDLIQYYSGIPGIDGVKVRDDLYTRQDLGSFEKAIIYSHFWNNILRDGELVDMMTAGRSGYPEIASKGSLAFFEPDIINLYTALHSEQYKRYIFHLLYAYRDPNLIHQQDGLGQCKCDICGKQIYRNTSWLGIAPSRPMEKYNKEYLAFFSEGSSTTVCLDCIAQLQYLTQLLQTIDPSCLTPFWIKNSIEIG